MLLFDNNINFLRHKDNVLPRINDVKTEIGKRNIILCVYDGDASINLM